jgi:glutamine synthetase
LNRADGTTRWRPAQHEIDFKYAPAVETADNVTTFRFVVKKLPVNLSEALDELEKDETVKAALDSHILENFLWAKRQEWADYITHVHPWEQERYLSEY